MPPELVREELAERLEQFIKGPMFAGMGPDHPGFVLGFRAGIALCAHYFERNRNHAAAAEIMKRWPYVFEDETSG